MRALTGGMSALALGTALLGQQQARNLEFALIPRAEIQARHAAGKPFFDTQWLIDADGTVVQYPNPAAGGSTRAGHPFIGENLIRAPTDPIPQELRSWLRDWSSALPWLAASLRQPGDLLGAVDAERHRTQLALPTDPATVRLQLLTVQADRELPATAQRRALLEREVAIRLLQQTCCRAARGEFEALRRDEDPFVVAAANDGLAALGDDGGPLPEAWSATPPAAGIDAWFWLDLRRLPARPDVAAAVRSACAAALWDQVLAAGGDVPNLALAGAQMIVDRPGEAPFEMARCWGRTRIDRCLVGITMLAGVAQLGWAEATGAFEVEALRTYLNTHGVAVPDAGPVKSDLWWHGFEVTVTADRIVVRADALAKQAAGQVPAAITESIAAGTAFAAWLPAEARVDRLPWLLLERGDSIRVHVSPFSLQVTAVADEAALRTRCSLLADQLESAAKHEDRAGYLPEMTLRSWLEALRQPRVTRKDSGATLELGGADLDPFALWPLLR